MTLQTDIARALSGYADALRRDDLDAVAASFTPDASVMAPDTPTATGPAVRDFYRDAMTASHLDIEFHIEQVVGTGREAVAFTHSTGTRTAPDGSSTPVHSREAFLVTRQADGDPLQIARYLFNRLA